MGPKDRKEEVPLEKREPQEAGKVRNWDVSRCDETCRLEGPRTSTDFLDK